MSSEQIQLNRISLGTALTKRTPRSGRWICPWMILVSFLSLVPPAWAQFGQAGGDVDNGITTMGIGYVNVRPSAVEFRTRIVGASEIAGDALLKYQQYRGEAIESLKKLGLENLTITVGGIATSYAGDYSQEMQVWGFGGGGMFMPQPAGAGGTGAKTEVSMSSVLRVRLNDLSKLSEEDAVRTVATVFDQLRDQGMFVVPINSVSADSLDAADQEIYQYYGQAAVIATYYVEGAKKIRQQARERAFAGAKENAEELAKLAGVKLGTVRAIREINVDNQSMMPARMMFMDDDGNDVLVDNLTDDEDSPESLADRVSSRFFRDVRVRVGLQVRFAIQEP